MIDEINRFALERDGYAILPQLFDAESIQAALAIIEAASTSSAESPARGASMCAVRNALSELPPLCSLATNAKLRSVIKAILGKHIWLVRAILFDKNAQANWSVPWHQDITIAVRDRIDVDGFGPWSVKSGVAHCQPPAAVLENMLTARLHLDDCNECNGALKVIPGSHRHGILNSESASRLAHATASRICEVQQGGVLLMRPLLLHASGRMTHAAHRRILHLEFAGMDLPQPLQWADAMSNWLSSTRSAQRNRPRATTWESSPTSGREIRSLRH